MEKDHKMMIQDYVQLMISKKLKDYMQVKLKGINSSLKSKDHYAYHKLKDKDSRPQAKTEDIHSRLFHAHIHSRGWDDYCLQASKLNRPVPLCPDARRAQQSEVFYEERYESDSDVFYDTQDNSEKDLILSLQTQLKESAELVVRFLDEKCFALKEIESLKVEIKSLQIENKVLKSGESELSEKIDQMKSYVSEHLEKLHISNQEMKQQIISFEEDKRMSKQGNIARSAVYQELDLDDNWDVVSADFDDSSVYSISEGEGDTHQNISVMVQDTPVEEIAFMAIEEDDEVIVIKKKNTINPVTILLCFILDHQQR
nr:hypothetical protein [Tanacetum cinerariifolium]